MSCTLLEAFGHQGSINVMHSCLKGNYRMRPLEDSGLRGVHLAECLAKEVIKSLTEVGIH